MSAERRTSRRVRISGVRVIYESGNGERVEADAVDLGTGGVFVRTAAPLAVGKRITLEMQVVGEQGPWSALGRVVWSREKGEGAQAPPGMGVKLIDADDAVLAAIERLVETRERTEPGVGKESTPPPPEPPVARMPERERTILGVGPSPANVASVPDDEVGVRDDEVKIAVHRSAPDDVLPAPEPLVLAPSPALAPEPETPPAERRGTAGRFVVMLLLLAVAGVAAYVLLEGFLHAPRGR
jgi:uncharacterized protein (TIGR02266 family)